MQRGRLVERLVEGAERFEQEAGHTRRRWFWPGKTERYDDEAENGDNLRRQQAHGVPIEFLTRGAKEEGDGVEDIRRPIGNDRPSQERHLLFPGKGKFRDVGAQRSKPVRRAIAHIEERSKAGEPYHRAPGRFLRSRVAGAWRDRAQAAGAPASRRSRDANETVKMP